MTTLLCLSDTHGSHYDLTVPDADVLIHAGDFNTYGHSEDTVDFLCWLEAQPHARKILIAGNHDKFPFTRATEFRKLLAKHAPSVTYLEDEAAEIDGLKVYGSPWTPAFLEWYFMADRGAAIQAEWDKIPDDVDVLITHGPPCGIHDRVPGDFMDPMSRPEHVGCGNLANTIRLRLKKLRLHVHGHIHMHGGKITVQDGVMYINAAVLSEAYEKAGNGIKVNL